MSSKTIAVDLQVYQKLARIKREGESFSRAIDRLADRYLGAHSGADILILLRDAPSPLSDDEERQMVNVIERSRREEEWDLHDLS